MSQRKKDSNNLNGEHNQKANDDSHSPNSAENSRGFVSDIILNAFEPGVNYSILVCLNVVFVFLLLTLVALCFITDFNIHLIIFIVLTVGLMIGLNM